MADPMFDPSSPDHELVAVYPDQRRADAARRALVGAGVPENEIHVDDDMDALTALRAEHHEELSDAAVLPNALYPRGAARGILIIGVVAFAIGLVIAFPLALIDFGATYWVRVIIVALIVGVGAFAIALVVGPATGAPRAAQPPDAARGTLLRVERDTPEIRELLTAHESIRVDEITAGGRPVDNVDTERDDSTVETIKDIAANTHGDDYHPER